MNHERGVRPRDAPDGAPNGQCERPVPPTRGEEAYVTRGLLDRGAAARKRAVRAVRAHQHAQHHAALFGHLDRVDAAAQDRAPDPADLAQRVLGADQLGAMVDQPARPEAAAALLVGDGGEDHVTRRASAGARQLDRHESMEHHGLTFDRAAAPVHAVGNDARERRMRPSFGRFHDVEMPMTR